MMTTTRAVIGRMLRPLLRAVEGQPRRGPFHLPLTGGWLPAGAPLNWWQTGISPLAGDRSAVVERCISLYAQTIASLPGSHWRANGRGGRTRVTNSALARILHRPNDYQSISDFLLNAVRSLYFEGNAYALALRNDRFEIDELHLMDAQQSSPQVIRANNEFNGEVFYRLGGNDVIEQRLATNERWLREQLLVPARDVLHIRLTASRAHPWPLVGEPPLVAALTDIAISSAFAEQQINFLKNQARPSAVLSTDLVLDKDQVAALRDRWNEQSKGLYQGGTPIITGGLKVQPWATPARDAQLAELQKLSAERICWAYGVPLQLLGLGGAPFSSTEALMRFWLSTGLGFALNHVEQSFDQLFDLEGQPNEYTEFSAEALLRADPKDRIEMLARGVQGGIYSPNEARAAEDLSAVEFGDEPRVQQQVVPLSAAAAIPAAPAPSAPPSAPTAEAAVKSYRAAVDRDIAALRAHATRPERTVALDRVDEQRGPVIRKTKLNGLQRPTLNR